MTVPNPNILPFKWAYNPDNHEVLGITLESSVDQEIMEKQSEFALSFSDLQRNELVDVWKRQYAGFVGGDEWEIALKQFEKGKTGTITTGHQCSFLGGPAYFFAKIKHAIEWAKQWNKQNGACQVVPVFWMATEDHDLEEVFEPLYKGSGAPKLSWDVGTMAGNFVWEGESWELLQEWFSNNKIPEVWSSCFQKGNTHAQVTRKLVHAMFPAEPLLVLDPNEPVLKERCIDIWERDLRGETLQSFETRKELYREKGWKGQVGAQPLNMFWMRDGRRWKIKSVNEHSIFLENGEEYPRDKDLWSCLSPNVILRPLYQQAILPNVCYIGGAAEMVYWDQLRSIFEAFGIHFPQLQLRNSLLEMKQSDWERWKSNDLEIWDLLRPWHRLEQVIIQRNISKELEKLDAFIKRMQSQVQEELGALLSSDFEAFKQGELKQLDKLKKRLERKLRKQFRLKQSELLNGLKVIHDSVRAHGVIQERIGHIDEFRVLGRNFNWENVHPFESNLILGLQDGGDR